MNENIIQGVTKLITKISFKARKDRTGCEISKYRFMLFMMYVKRKAENYVPRR